MLKAYCGLIMEGGGEVEEEGREGELWRGESKTDAKHAEMMLETGTGVRAAGDTNEELYT